MTKLHLSIVSKMSLIQPQKFRTLKMGCFKMPRLQMPHLQMAVFQMGVAVASGHNRCKPSHEASCLVAVNGMDVAFPCHAESHAACFQ